MFNSNKFAKTLALVASLTVVSINTYATSTNNLTIDGVGHGGKNNISKRLPTWMRFYNIQGLEDTKPGIKIESISQFDDKKLTIKMSSRKGYDTTSLAQRNATVGGSGGGVTTNFSIWGKMTLAGYPFLGLTDIHQYSMHARNRWSIDSVSDAGSHYTDPSHDYIILRTANHYRYDFNLNGSSASHITINPHKESYVKQQLTLKMEMPFIHLTSMPEGYYLTEEQARSKGFDFNSFNKDGDFFNEHQMVVTKPNGDEFYFQTCMPQSNLIYNEDTQELSCESSSGLPEKIPGCTALYYFADGKATMYCENGNRSKSLNPSTVSDKYKKYFLTSNDLYNCKIGSLTADKANGITCEIDSSVNQPVTGYNYKNAGETIKLLPESATFTR